MGSNQIKKYDAWTAGQMDREAFIMQNGLAGSNVIGRLMTFSSSNPSSSEFGFTIMTQQVYSCGACGALVMDGQQHQHAGWHLDLYV